MQANKKNLWLLFLSESMGTALMLALGLSVVIFMWGKGSSMSQYIPSLGLRRLLTGFLFGCAGCLVTLSPVGRISGAHINPAVSIAFWLIKKMRLKTMLGFIASQMVGAVLACSLLLFWGEQGRSIGYGSTSPGAGGIWPAILGELVCTAVLIADIFMLVGSPRFKKYTPFSMPPLYAIMVWAETSYSGCSTNPARSFGPALVSGNFSGHWIYWVAPLLGVLIAVSIYELSSSPKGDHSELEFSGF